jgi:hypothetical protein
MLVVTNYRENEMSTEKKPDTRRRNISADIPFYLALAFCLIGLAFSVLYSQLEEAISCVLIAIAFTAIRYFDKGAWRALRSLIFFILASILGAEIISGAIGLSLVFAFIMLPFLILAFWLYIAG